MNLLPVDEFLEGLEEWNKTRNGSIATDYLSLLIITNVDLGMSKSAALNQDTNIEEQRTWLRERILSICQNERINQVMLIEGIVSRITRYFSNGFKALVNNLKLSEKMREREVNSPTMERFKTIEYGVDIELDEQVWNEIVSKRFSKHLFNLMDNYELDKELQTAKKYIDNMPEEDKNLTLKEIREKYSN